MPAGSWFTVICEAPAGIELGIVHRRLDATTVYGIFVRARPNLPRRHLDSVGKCVAKAFPVNDHPGQLNNGRGIAPSKLQSSSLLFRQDSVLVTFDGKSNHAATRDGVYPS